MQSAISTAASLCKVIVSSINCSYISTIKFDRALYCERSVRVLWARSRTNCTIFINSWLLPEVKCPGGKLLRSKPPPEHFTSGGRLLRDSSWHPRPFIPWMPPKTVLPTMWPDCLRGQHPDACWFKSLFILIFSTCSNWTIFIVSYIFSHFLCIQSLNPCVPFYI